jgi:hypothetical protein
MMDLFEKRKSVDRRTKRRFRAAGPTFAQLFGEISGQGCFGCAPTIVLLAFFDPLPAAVTLATSHIEVLAQHAADVASPTDALIPSTRKRTKMAVRG